MGARRRWTEAAELGPPLGLANVGLSRPVFRVCHQNQAMWRAILRQMIVAGGRPRQRPRRLAVGGRCARLPCTASVKWVASPVANTCWLLVQAPAPGQSGTPPGQVGPPGQGTPPGQVGPPGQGAPPGQVQVAKKAKLTQALQRGSATISQLVKLEKKAGERLLASVAHAAVVHMASKDSLVSPFFAQPSHSPRHTINGCSLYV